MRRLMGRVGRLMRDRRGLQGKAQQHMLLQGAADFPLELPVKASRHQEIAPDAKGQGDDDEGGAKYLARKLHVTLPIGSLPYKWLGCGPPSPAFCAAAGHVGLSLIHI